MAKAVKTVTNKTPAKAGAPTSQNTKTPSRKIYMAAKPSVIGRARIRAAVRAMSKT